MRNVRSIVLSLILAGFAFGQASPNCNQINQQLASAIAGQNYNNTGQQKCSVFQLKYYAEGFSALSLQVEFAPDVAGVPGAFTIVPGASVVLGSNPSTNTTSGVIIVNGYWPWLRINITSVTGTGFINYNFIGSAYIAPPTATSSAGGLAANVVATGPDAPGAASTGNPLQMAGWTGAVIKFIVVDSAGRIFPAGSTAGGAISGGPVQSGVRDQAGNAEYTAGDVQGHPLNGTFPTNNLCTGILDSVALMAVPTSNTKVPFASDAVTHCVSFFVINNTTAGSLTVSITDNQGSPITFLSSFSIPANSQLLQPLYGMAFKTGINWIASNTGLTGAWVATQ